MEYYVGDYSYISALEAALTQYEAEGWRILHLATLQVAEHLIKTRVIWTRPKP